MSTEWRKATPEDVQRFQAATEGIEGLEARKMFGYPAVFTGGNLVAGVYEDRVMVRLSEADLQERLDAGWAGFEPMPGRPMRGYVTLPAEVFADVAATRGWIERAAAYVRTLPPKEAKAKAKAEGKAARARKRS